MAKKSKLFPLVFSKAEKIFISPFITQRSRFPFLALLYFLLILPIAVSLETSPSFADPGLYGVVLYDGSSLHQALLTVLSKLHQALYDVVCTMGNVVELKVNLHCDECIRKILKAIKKIQDIETYDVDTELNKVTVTGNVTTEEVVRVLHKVRKTAIKWEDNDEISFN